MLPGMYEFHWVAGHLIFLGCFFGVLLVVLSTIAAALFRARRTLNAGRGETMCWAESFANLPESSRACRHQITGAVERRTCKNGFDCRNCAFHDALLDGGVPHDSDYRGADSAGEIAGFALPTDRLYHRGHAWVRPEPDGTATVGLDDFASRLVGPVDKIVLPRRGERVRVNGTAWRMGKDGVDLRVLSPVDGVVLRSGDPSKGWYLKVQPEGGAIDDRGLLRGHEAKAWLLREVERLQAALSRREMGAVLADGGLPVENLWDTIPAPGRDAVLGEMLLDL